MFTHHAQLIARAFEYRDIEIARFIGVYDGLHFVSLTPGQTHEFDCTVDPDLAFQAFCRYCEYRNMPHTTFPCTPEPALDLVITVKE
jgi:hypothetical protein